MQNASMQTSHKKDLRLMETDNQLGCHGYFKWQWWLISFAMDTPNKNEIILQMIRTHFKQCTANDADFFKMSIRRCASNKNGQQLKIICASNHCKQQVVVRTLANNNDQYKTTI